MKDEQDEHGRTIIFAGDCSPCPMCDEPVCPFCKVHYYECSCIGPDSEPEEDETVNIRTLTPDEYNQFHKPMTEKDLPANCKKIMIFDSTFEDEGEDFSIYEFKDSEDDLIDKITINGF